MDEVWERGGKFGVFRPVAWFMDSDDAQDYVDYLLTLGREARAVYNATATMPEWDAPEGFSPLSVPSE